MRNRRKCEHNIPTRSSNGWWRKAGWIYTQHRRLSRSIQNNHIQAITKLRTYRKDAHRFRQILIEEVLGKSYGISASKFMRKSVNLKGTNGEDIVDVKRTFQCAELVAKMYKVLGLLPESSSSGKFVPGSWTAKKKTQLEKGEFGPEWVISFDDSS